MKRTKLFLILCVVLTVGLFSGAVMAQETPITSLVNNTNVTLQSAPEKFNLQLTAAEVTEVNNATAFGVALTAGGEIKLIQDITYESSSQITIAEETTIDLNGHALTVSPASALRYGFQIGTNADSTSSLSIKDGAGGGTMAVNCSSTSTSSAFYVYGTLNIQGGAVTMNATKANSYGVNMNGSGTFKMSGGKLIAGTNISTTKGLYANSGTKMISGGVLDCAIYAGTNPSGWSVTGGVFNAKPVYQMVTTGKVAYEITDGEYNGKYGIKDGTLYGLVGTTEYTNIEAFANAIGGDKITVDGSKLTLTDDVTLASSTANKVTFLYNLELDLAGHRLSGATNGSKQFLLYVDKETSTLKISDSVGGGSIENITAGNCYVLGVNAGRAELTGVKVVATNTGTNYTYAVYLLTNKASAKLDHCTILAENAGVKTYTHVVHISSATCEIDGTTISMKSVSGGEAIKMDGTAPALRIGQNSSDMNTFTVESAGDSTSASNLYGIYMSTSSAPEAYVKNCDITVNAAAQAKEFEQAGIYQKGGILDIQDKVTIDVIGDNTGLTYGIYSSNGTSRGISGSNVTINVAGSTQTSPKARYGFYLNNATNFVINPGTNVAVNLNTNGVATGAHYLCYAFSTGLLAPAGGTYTGGTLQYMLACGGIFDSDPSEYCAPGYKAEADTPAAGQWTVVPDATEYIRNETQSKNYTNVLTAFDEAEEGDTLILLADAEYKTSDASINGVTIELSGHTLTLRELTLTGTVCVKDSRATSFANAGTLKAKLVQKAGSTTLSKVNYVGEGKVNDHLVEAGTGTAGKLSRITFSGVNATLTNEAVTTNSYNYVFYTNAGGSVYFDSTAGFDSVVTATGSTKGATYLFCGGTNDAEFSIRNTAVTLNNPVGSAYLFYTGNSKGVPASTIESGYFTVNSLKSLAATKATAKISITGGYFVGYDNTAVVAKDTFFGNVTALTGGQYTAVELTSGTEYDAGYRYQVTSEPVCKIDDVSYTSLQAAINDAEAGDTISLLMNCGAYSLNLDKAITITDNGYKVTAAGDVMLTVAKDIDIPACIDISAAAAYIEKTDGTKVYYKNFKDFSYNNAPAAIDKFNSTTDTQIVMLNNIVLDTCIIINKNLTLDLNGYTISRNDDSRETTGVYGGATVTITDSSLAQTGKITGNSANYTFDLYKGTLILESGTIENTGTGSAICCVGTTYSKVKDCSLIVNGGKIIATNGFAFADNGSASENINVTVNGGELTSTNGVAIYHPASGLITLNGGVITGKTAIYLRSGSITVPAESTTKVIATGAKNAHDPEYSGGALSTGDALVICESDYPCGSPAANICGGYFHSENACAVASYATTGQTAISKFIQGGYYSDIPAESLIKDGYQALANVEAATKDDYPYLVGIPVASITKDSTITNYATLADAVTAAEDGDTVTLLTDLTDETVDLTKANTGYTLDLNGKTLALKPTGYVLNVPTGKTVTVKNGTLTIDGTNLPQYSSGCEYLIGITADNSALNFDSVDLTAKNITYPDSGDNDWYIFNLDAGNLNLTNGSKLTIADSASGFYAPAAQTGRITVKDSEISLSGITDYAFHCDRITLDNSKLTAKDSDSAVIFAHSGLTADNHSVIEIDTVWRSFSGTDNAHGECLIMNADSVLTESNAEIASFTGNVTIPANTDITFNSDLTVCGTAVIDGGRYKGTFAKGNGSATIAISGGMFAVRPDTAYIANGKVVKLNTDEATMKVYPFIVGDPEATEVNVSVIPNEVLDSDVTTEAGATQQQVNAVTEANTAITETSNTSDFTVSGVGVEKASTKVAEENKVKGSDTTYETATGETSSETLVEAVDATPQAEATQPSDIAIVVQTYSDVKVADVTMRTETGNETLIQTITYDIQPMTQKVATSTTVAESAKADATIIKTEGTDQNAVKIGTPQKLMVTDTTKVTIPLPDTFVDANGNKYADKATVYIKHVKSDGQVYYYIGTIINNSTEYAVTFDNPNGFSKFTIMADAETKVSVTQNGSTVYFADLQSAVDYVENDGVITLIAADAGNAVVDRTVSFTFNKGTYTGEITEGKCTTGTVTGNKYDFVFKDEYSITVTESANGTASVAGNTAKVGDTVTINITPDTGYTLETITVTDSNHQDIEVNTDDDTYYFTMPKADVTVTATFMEDNSMLNFFTDVSKDDYFYSAVLWAAENDIAYGVGNSKFAPYDITTRAQMVTFLWRAAGCPEPTITDCPFTDVENGSYYEKAVLWATEEVITKGTSATTFSPDDTVLRCQAVTFLARMSGVDDDDEGYSHPFPDVTNTAYYYNAVSWAFENGITNGVGKNLFAPNAKCKRCETVTFLWRYYKDR